MSEPLKTWSATLTTLFCLLVFLTGCGGGGGSDGAKSGRVVDPASSFKGVTTAATPTNANAEDLAMGGFGGGSIAASIGSVAKLSSKSAEATNKRPVLQLVQMLKQSVRRMEIPQNSERLRKTSQSAVVAAKSSARANNYQLHGDSGGTATYSVDVNDATGSFFGTVVYAQYSSKGTVIDGTTEVLGSMDIDRQQISRLTFSFSSLTFRSDKTTVSLTGSLSWGFNFISQNETLSMNMVLLDKSSAKTFWFKNYEITTAYTGDDCTQNISGRYFDHDYGYVDVTTLTPVVVSYGYDWPSQGSLKFSGSNGRWVQLDFRASSFVVKVDSDGIDEADWQVERPVNLRPSIDLPPTADAGSDQTIKQWATVQLDGSVSSDPNGDALTYSWQITSSPSGSDYTYTSLVNANTATPSFIAERSGTYVLSLSIYDGHSYSTQDTVSIVVTPIIPSDPTFLEKQWQFGTYGYSIGQTGLFATDLDGDGTVEIIASASAEDYGRNVLWYVLRRNTSEGYDQVWQSPNYGVAIVRMLLTDMNGDGKNDVVVALVDGTVHIYNEKQQKIRTVMVAPQLADLAIADLDGNGTKEIVASDGMEVFVYDAGSGALRWSVKTGGGKSIAVGNTDADPTMEIVTTTYGGKGYVLNGLSGAINWEYINSFGARVRLSDLDGDGMQEIIGAAPWQKITIFDADLKSPAWEITTALDITSIIVSDADGDGIPEIIYGDGQWGKTHAIDVRSHAEKWSVNNPGYIVEAIVLADVDLDGKKELLWGTSGTTLYIADPLTGTIKWKNASVNGLHAVAVGDIDNDGEDEVVMASVTSDNKDNDGILYIFNARTHDLIYQLNLGTRDYDTARRVVRIGDVDGDGRLEFVVSTATYYTGAIRVYDGATYTLKRQSPVQNNHYFTAFTLADVDNDGKTEIVAALRVNDMGVYLVVLDGVSMQEKWRSVDLGVNWKSINDIKIADLDKNGHPDIIASLADNRLIVFDGVNHNLKLMKESPARAIEVADVDGDGSLEILVGRNDGKIDVYDGVTFAMKRTASTYGNSPIDALLVTDMDNNGTLEWLVASNNVPYTGVLSILDNHGLKWRSSNLDPNLGKNNSIAVKDVNGDGRKDIFIGSGSMLYHFK